MARRANDRGPGLFQPKRGSIAPLAERMRPRTLDEVVGQEHVLGPGKLLNRMASAGALHSLILWGPPGSGKTTIARLLAEKSGAAFRIIAAVSAGIADLRDAVVEARRALDFEGRRTAVFIDEIHRWNRAQQDAILPHVESGLITLIGATTENPSFEVIAPLLSRARVVVLHPLGEDQLATLVARALVDSERGLGSSGLEIEPNARDEIVRICGGDARRALGTLEVAAELALDAGRRAITLGDVSEAAQHQALRYDRAGEEHYNVISAFIKSLRGSDPDAALYWLMRMVEAGEEPLFIARRMVIFAAEDIGNADPHALQMALAVKDAVDFVGLPEGVIPLAQGVTYLATAPKSNASYRAMLAARSDVREFGPLPVPLHLRNAPTPLMKGLGYGADYQYPHDYDGALVDQAYRPDRLEGKTYYFPSDRGEESRIRAFLEDLRRRRHALNAATDPAIRRHQPATKPEDAGGD
ncbi:MAG TPA: replication-associated recombination protein A [Candidatus Binataceae bacterium]|jgi:putative ATPase|nr:replication-associated recombination protein A [Candidatus Binataceae bacterium]